ncbi:MAG: VCBS repeat-containing protein [Acidobacteriota bacterium]
MTRQKLAAFWTLLALASAVWGGQLVAGASEDPPHEPLESAQTSALSALELEILEALTTDQLSAWLAGADEHEIILATGESLAEFLALRGASSFELAWFTIDAGGGTSSGGVFEISGTIGQPTVGAASGGPFSLEAGFWTFEAARSDWIGVYRGRIFTRDTDGSGTSSAADTICLFGVAGDEPITGDWNGDGKDEIGVYRRATPENGLVRDLFLLDSDGSCSWNPAADQLCQFGLDGDAPIVGDWNGDGDDDIGVTVGRLFFQDLDESCTWTPATDRVDLLGLVGDEPIIGDWNGDGDDNIGVYRPSSRLYLMDLDEDGRFMLATDLACLFGLAGDQPIIGDWNRDGDDDIGVYRPASRLFLMDRNESCTFSLPEDLWAIYGLAGDQPIVGRW